MNNDNVSGYCCQESVQGVQCLDTGCTTVVWYTVYRVYSAGSDGWLGVSLKMRKSVMMTGCDPVW